MSQSSTGTYQRHSKLLTVASSEPRLCKSFISEQYFTEIKTEWLCVFWVDTSVMKQE